MSDRRFVILTPSASFPWLLLALRGWYFASYPTTAISHTITLIVSLVLSLSVVSDPPHCLR